MAKRRSHQGPPLPRSGSVGPALHHGSRHHLHDAERDAGLDAAAAPGPAREEGHPRCGVTLSHRCRTATSHPRIGGANARPGSVSRSAAVLGGADLRDVHDGPDQRSDVMTMHLLDHLLLYVGRRSAPSGIPVTGWVATPAPNAAAPHEVHVSVDRASAAVRRRGVHPSSPRVHRDNCRRVPMNRLARAIAASAGYSSVVRMGRVGPSPGARRIPRGRRESTWLSHCRVWQLTLDEVG
jgi:hypothetical protein